MILVLNVTEGNHVQVHPSSVLKTDEEGHYPNYAVYHELIVTSRPFMRNVCEVEMPWANPILKKLEKLDIKKLRYYLFCFSLQRKA